MIDQRKPSNIEIVFAEWLDAMRRGDIDRMTRVLAPHALHQGIRPEWRCESREEILENVRPRLGNPPHVDALELVAAGDCVVMSVKGPGIGPPVHDTEGDFHDQASIVFTLQDGKITHMQDFLHRHDALTAAGASPAWQ